MKKKTSIKPLESLLKKEHKKNEMERFEAASKILDKHISKARSSIKKAIFALMKSPKIDKKTLETLKKMDLQLSKRSKK